MLNTLYKTPQNSAYLLILFIAILSTLYNAYLPLHGDEAYYWMWSHHLQSGYYDHPPMIAYFIFLTNFISESEWGIRLVNVFSMSISALYIFKLSHEMFGEKVALNALIIFSSVILVHAGYILTTPDSPLILFWTLSLYYAYRAIFYGATKDYLLTGVMLGLMMLSKYSAILFVFMLLIFIVLKRRDIFLNRNFYFAVLVASIVVSPMLWWNYQNEWISFAFQLEHGSSKTFELYPNLFLEFFAGQFGIFSPVFTAILFYFLVKERLYFKEEKLFFLSLSIITILLFFFYKSFFTRMELNYAAPAYIGGAILTAYIFERYKLVRTFKVGLIIAITFTIIGRLGFLFYLEIVQDRMYGNREAVQLLQTHSQKGDSFYGDHLTIAAYLNYYLKERPETDVILESRFSQYDMWREDDFLKDGLVLTRDPEEVRLSALYNDIKLIDSITVKKGIKGEKTLYIYRVTNVK
ncbi:MAG: glycosyltransferase family 39 protein [Epsilonproteobacteria bacterium]|nr:glycosyltransferase family 39 protein [Campylobacterota bacterium]OIO13277.1 MAG: dolichyl-phosphate-mannose--protein mannosyltransferase [Helicobacteraceae bacterium CG1_02_36_14]PIP11028.1 MAG: dolichyl-phosphate-mannose--protein mannosyltransferase [Sulfurimonas sp. CG23_combo_of_CG06-09_8_20_14_all_36_33]PIS25413.1 MAG: dolichyl-phosphate-mannose--protein mannosyltransferase [Sulfurimonas sp. CG08_land_8_20_14_0_20_36_33]PIU36106.1 MAG: dolichyl-phosphate-mannose--protein mannosyltransfe